MCFFNVDTNLYLTDDLGKRSINTQKLHVNPVIDLYGQVSNKMA